MITLQNDNYKFCFNKTHRLLLFAMSVTAMLAMSLQLHAQPYTCANIYTEEQSKTTNIKLAEKTSSELTEDQVNHLFESLWRLQINLYQLSEQYLKRNLSAEESRALRFKVDLARSVLNQNISIAMIKISDFSKRYQQFRSNKQKDKSPVASINKTQTAVKLQTEYDERKRLEEIQEVSNYHQPDFFKIADGEYLMNALVTQKMYADLKLATSIFLQKDYSQQELSPSANKPEDPDQAFVLFGYGSISLFPNNPVENIAFTAIQELINDINILSRSDNFKAQEILKKYIIGHQKGDQYALPSRQNFEKASKLAHTIEGVPLMEFIKSQDENVMKDYFASLKSNRSFSDKDTDSRLDKAFLIHGKAVYLFSDLFEWTGDVSKNAFGDPSGDNFVRGPVMNLSGKIEINYWLTRNIKKSYANVGFRLMRTRKH